MPAGLRLLLSFTIVSIVAGRNTEAVSFSAFIHVFVQTV